MAVRALFAVHVRHAGTPPGYSAALGGVHGVYREVYPGVYGGVYIHRSGSLPSLSPKLNAN